MVGEAEFGQADGNGTRGIFARLPGRVPAERRVHVIISGQRHAIQCRVRSAGCRIKNGHWSPGSCRGGAFCEALVVISRVRRRPFLPQPAKGGWRESENGSEHTGKVKWVGEAHLFRHLFHQGVGLLQAPGGQVHF